MRRCGLLHMLKLTCVGTFLCLYFAADCILSDRLWPVVLLLRVELHGGGDIHENLISWLTTQHKLQDCPLIWSPLQVDLGQKTIKHQTCIQWSSTAMRKQRALETETEFAPDFSGWSNLTLSRLIQTHSYHSEMFSVPIKSSSPSAILQDRNLGLIMLALLLPLCLDHRCGAHACQASNLPSSWIVLSVVPQCLPMWSNVGVAPMQKTVGDPAP